MLDLYKHFNDKQTMLLGDCLQLMKKLPDNLFDSIITDPPYALEFMGKSWDKVLPSIDIWRECLRVAKPGTILLAFGGTRTFHRLTCNIEDAGWEVRDCIMWLYGSGFPKSHNIAKAIDKKAGKEKIIGKGRAGKTALGQSSAWNKTYNPHEYNITEPNTPEANLWEGWGTALKPAWEPIIVAMKPLDGTYVENALKHNVSGLNIDGSRIETSDKLSIGSNKRDNANINFGMKDNKEAQQQNPKGRFPANVILDDEAGQLLDEQTGVLKSGTGEISKKSSKILDGNNSFALGKESRDYGALHVEYGDSGGASRFFYCAKAGKKERGEGNNHPTVKPLKLMEYLCNLTKTPTGGIVFDPFAGSGTTGVACVNTGRGFVGMDKVKEHFDIACKRIK